MRELRGKSADREAKPYFLKTAKEGISLSWNHYEKMVPQDAFSSLGLTCHDCLMGPCRINPFGDENEKTVCGLDREELAVRTFSRFTGIVPLEGGEAASAFFAGALPALEKLYAKNPPETAACVKSIGLGVLKPDCVNIALERASASFLETLIAYAKEHKAMASGVSARDFSFSLIGGAPAASSPDIACDAGSAELAVATGLIDAYITGGALPSRARNLAGKYHTVFYSGGGNTFGAGTLEKILEGACKAYAAREKNRLLPSAAQVEARFSGLADIETALQKRPYKGICLLGGSSNLKLTQDSALSFAAQSLSGVDLLCAAFGEAAVILGKHGFLDGRSGVLGFRDAASLPALLNLPHNKSTLRYAYFPELCGREDILGLLACANSGVMTWTSTRLPCEGAECFSKSIGGKISYGKPKDIVDSIVRITREGSHGN